jgi:uncharacterized protein YbaA (DUF1428 family)
VYVDGFVLCVPTKKLPAYKRLAKKAAVVWMDHGALQYCECVGDDLKVKGMLSFLELAKPKKGETVVFSWITHASRKQRDKVNAAVMKDPRLADLMPADMPFDMKRMAMGGFEVLVERGSRRR